jgi:hypothetical protein
MSLGDEKRIRIFVLKCDEAWDGGRSVALRPPMAKATRLLEESAPEGALQSFRISSSVCCCAYNIAIDWSDDHGIRDTVVLRFR